MDYCGFQLALAGLPDDIAMVALEHLQRVNATAQTYRLPLVTSGLGFNNLSGGDATPRFLFPTIGVIFGVSRRVVFSDAADDIIDLGLIIQDSSSNRDIVGVEQQTFNLSGVPDPSQGALDFLRISPVACYPETQWNSKIRVLKSGNLVGTARGIINLVGIGFWIQGSQITSRGTGPNRVQPGSNYPAGHGGPGYPAYLANGLMQYGATPQQVQEYLGAMGLAPPMRIPFG